MNTWQERLQHALTVRQKRYTDLVKATGLSAPSVHAWKPDAKYPSKMINGDSAAIVCSTLRINAMWLFHGKGFSGLEKQDQNAQEKRTDYLVVTESERLTRAWEKLPEAPKQALLTLAEHLAKQQIQPTPQRRKTKQPITTNVDLAQSNDAVAKLTGDSPSNNQKTA